MRGPSRRTLLCASAGLFTFAAGCLDEAGVSSSDDDTDGNESGDETGNGGDEMGNSGEETDNGGDEPTAAGDLESTATVSYDHADVPTEPEATLITTGERAAGWLDDRQFDEEAAAEFVDQTSFEESVLVAVESDAPNLCYEMVLEDVALEGDGEADDDARLSIAAAVSDESDEDEVCGQQMIAVGQLVRATFETEPVTSASVAITESDGEKREIGIGVGSDSESEAESDEETTDDS